jgi:5-methylcytosine-specific restriction endonuclease McrA
VKALILAVLLAFSLSAVAGTKRSRYEVVKFKEANTCPSTGLKRKGPCPGHEVDHIIPLCAGGADKVENMQWLQVEVHKVKTKKDVKHCAILRKAKTTPTS